jgi:putative FmdB family regulatory protein
MPTYDYECDACGHKFELFQRITEDPIKKCPECKKNKLQRLFGTGAAVVFKGSGFYQTDYRSESYKKGAESAKEQSSDKTSDKSDKKSDGKTGSDSAKSDSGSSGKADSKNSDKSNKGKKKES